MVVNNFVEIMKMSHTVFKLLSGHEYVTEITNYTVQRAITPKVGKSQSCLLFSACRFMILDISVKFVTISQTGFKLHIGNVYMTKITNYNFQRAITPKVVKP